MSRLESSSETGIRLTLETAHALLKCDPFKGDVPSDLDPAEYLLLEEIGAVTHCVDHDGYATDAILTTTGTLIALALYERFPAGRGLYHDYTVSIKSICVMERA